jgi:predicted unusual protein kinase regulating ubiquinone biosynthesis (AarF/ABC1/UbiB family)
MTASRIKYVFSCRCLRLLATVALSFSIWNFGAPSAYGEINHYFESARKAVTVSEQPDHAGVIPTSHALALQQSQNMVLKILLAGYKGTNAAKLKTLQRVESTLARFVSQTRLILQVNTVEELHDLEEKYKPQVWDYQDEVTLLKTQLPPYIIVATQSEDVRAELVAMSALLQQNQFISHNVGNLSLEPLYLQYLTNQEAAQNALSVVPAQAKLLFCEGVDRVIEGVLSEINSVGSRISNSGGLHLSDSTWQRFLQLLIGEYFKKVTLETKLQMAGELIRLGPHSSTIDRFAILVGNAGPQFQKLFQVYARDAGFSDDLKAIFARLEQNGRAVPWRIVNSAIKSQPVPFEWLEIHQESLGVGTMAQVHAATIRWPDGRVEKVVLRILKPDVARRVSEDNQALGQVAEIVDNDPILRKNNFTLISPFVSQIEEMSAKEANLGLTIGQQQQGRLTYSRVLELKTPFFNGQLEFGVPKVYDLGPNPKLMVQEYIPGTSFEKFSASNPELSKLAVEELSKFWIDTTLNGSGFFHADLHQGNLRVEMRDGRVRVYLLDFGMTGQLTRANQNQFILFAIASKLRDPQLMARILYAMSDKKETKLTEDQIREILLSEINRQKGAGVANITFNQWITLSVNAGVRFPVNFTALNRGIELVSAMLLNSHSTLDPIGVLRANLLRNPRRLKELALSTGLLTARDIIRLTMAALKKGDAGQPPIQADQPSATKGIGQKSTSGVLCRDLFN